MDEREIESLLAAAARGEKQAFGPLFRRTSPRLFALCLRILQDRGEAEEALLDAFGTIWRHAGRHPATGTRPLTFMTAITRDVCTKRLHARGGRVSALATAEEVAAAAERTDGPATDDTGRRLASCLAAMDPAEARLVRTAYFSVAGRARCSSRELPLGNGSCCALFLAGHGGAAASFVGERVGAPMASAPCVGPFGVEPDGADGLPVACAT